MNKRLNLPRTKEIDGKHFPYLSYSAKSSLMGDSLEFKNQAILNYIFGIKLESRFEIYAEYGSHVGEYIETNGKKRGNLLSDEDCAILDKFIATFKGESEYEREIWIDRGNYHILGYIDRWNKIKKFTVDVIDFKTGAKKKVEEYGSEKYGQTTLYSYFETLQGNEVRESFVQLLVREGNPLSKHNPTDFKLTGEIIKVPTPYSKERAEKELKKMDKAAELMADLHTTYNQLKNLKIKL